MKLVKESLNQTFSRSDNNDKLSSVGVGKIAAIRSYLKDMAITEFDENEDGTIDIFCPYELDVENLENLIIEPPSYLKIRNIFEDPQELEYAPILKREIIDYKLKGDINIKTMQVCMTEEKYSFDFVFSDDKTIHFISYFEVGPGALFSGRKSKDYVYIECDGNKSYHIDADKWLHLLGEYGNLTIMILISALYYGDTSKIKNIKEYIKY